MKTILITLVASLISIFSFAQNFGEIHGTVKDHVTGEVIPFATVSTEYGGKLIGVTADLDGRFKLKPLHPGTYDLKFQYLGFDTRTVQGIEVTPNKIYVLGPVELATNNQLPVFVVEAIQLFDKDLPNAMVIKAADIKHNAMLKSPAKLIGSLTPELKTDENGMFLVRGGRPGSSITMIDGIKISGAMGNIPGSAIRTITVHTGGIPAKYGDLTGGVVVIETKSYFDYFYDSNRGM